MAHSCSTCGGGSSRGLLRTVWQAGYGRSSVACAVALASIAFAQPAIAGSSASFRRSPQPALDGDSVDQAQPATCVFLATRPTNTGPGLDGGILLRELFRQALLIAARDGLGLQTRDMTLRELGGVGANSTDATVGGCQALDLNVTVRVDQAVQLELRRGLDPNMPPAWEHQYPLAVTEGVNYAEIVQLAERLSRQDLVAALQALGCNGPGPVRESSADLPAGLARQLDDMSPLAQFAALRVTHDAIRREGKSPALCGALVRGYANLCASTGMLWNASYKAYAARALLYAERIVAAEPESAGAFWHRAYARALVGLHGAALEDLERAGELARGAAIPPAAPQWVALLGIYCRYDAEVLASEGVLGKPTSQLADLLAGLAGTESLGARADATLTRDVLRRNPECYRVLDDCLERAGVGEARWLTLNGPLTLSRTLPRRLRAMAGLPDRVRGLLPKPPGLWEALLGGRQHEGRRVADAYLAQQREIDRALRTAGMPGADTGEPSWDALAGMLEDLTFVHAYRRARLVVHMWDLAGDDFVEAVEPLIAAHPYALWLLSFKARYTNGGAPLAELWRDLRVTDADFPLKRLLQQMRQLPKGEVYDCGQAAWNRMFWHADAIAGDLERTIAASKQRAARAARQLRAVSPHAPAAVATLITHDWDAVADEARGWEREYAHDAPVLEALARQYLRLQRREDALRVLRASCALSVDYWAWTTLAYLCREDGDVARWKQMLETYLVQYEDMNLEHAHIRDELARYYMSIAEYATALPYAEAATQSGAAWAMEGAALANEGLGRWAAAEQWYQRQAERYSGDSAVWLFFCVRTGQGERRAAESLALDWARKLSDDAPATPLQRAAVVRLLAGHELDARHLLERSFRRVADPLAGHLLAAIADAGGQGVQRDEWLARIVANVAGSETKAYAIRPEQIELAKIFQHCLSAGAVAPADLQAVEGLVDSATPRNRSGVLYFTARFLEQHGAPEDAQAWLRRAAHDPMQINLTVCLARELCRARGLPLEPVPPRVEPVTH